MFTKSEYQAKIAELLDQITGLEELAAAENRMLNDDELRTKNKAMDLIEDYKDRVESTEREERLRSQLTAKPAPETLEGPKANKRTPGRIEVGLPNASKETFRSFGEQMVAVMKAGLPGGRVDPRLLNATGLGETIPADGGFLVQDDFSSELLNDIMETGQVASRCRRIQIGSNSNGVKINGVDETSRATGSRQGGIRGYWAAEAAEKTASKPKFRQISLELKKLVGLCYATDELVEDSTALGSYLQQGFTSEMAFLLDDAIINGSGAGTPLGIMNSGCLVTQTAVSGQGATTFVGANAVSMRARLFASSRTNAVWFINQDVEPQLHQMLLGTDNLVYTPPGGLSGQPYGTLFGNPVNPIEQCATLGTTGDVILADMSGYLLAEKGGVSMDASIHVRFIYDEMCYRWVLRVDGQPLRASALTPYKGSNTQSHFIVLHSTRT